MTDSVKMKVNQGPDFLIFVTLNFQALLWHNQKCDKFIHFKPGVGIGLSFLSPIGLETDRASPTRADKNRAGRPECPPLLKTCRQGSL